MSESIPRPPRTNAGTPAIDACLRAWFDQLLDLELDADASVDWINTHVEDADARATLHKLVTFDRGEGPFDTAAEVRMARIARDPETLVEGMIGTQIGAFRIERILGQGGMATVFLGRRIHGDFEQCVALKLLRRGLYTEAEQRLFRREQRVLATLSHPNIAHLLDGGITPAGIPYLAIEFIDGMPITEYADTHQLDLRARLALFAVVCDAVRAAHRALVVHRDLKPSNIYVDRAGTVKLLDFGIAKLLDDDERDATGTGHVALTPGYAAPEQFSGAPISTATDVYALGIVLHELLTGERPRNGVAVSHPNIRGDLGNIIGMALADEPERRYASAHELADDISRYLNAKPVTAHPPSRWYRARKFTERHRGGVALTALFGIALLASLGVTLLQAREARLQAARANTVRDVLINVFDSARARLPRDQRPTPEALVAQAQRKVGALGALDAETRIDLLRTLAEVWLSLSQFAEAETALSEADVAARSLQRDDLIAGIAISRADGWQRASDPARAIAAIEPLLPRLRKEDSPLLLRALGVFAAAQLTANGPAAALALHREAVDVASRRHGAKSVEALTATLELGDAFTASQMYPAAVEQLQPALGTWRETQAPEDDRYVRGLGSLATAEDGLGNVAHAAKLQEEVLTLKGRIYPPLHDAIASSKRDLASALGRNDKNAEAERMFDEALAMQIAIFGPTHREIAITHDSFAHIFVQQRRFEEGERHYRAALAICASLALRDEVCSRAHNNLGQMYYRMDRLGDAQREMLIALDERRALFGDDHPTVAYSLGTLANVAARDGRPEEAVRLSRQAVAQLERIGFGLSTEAILTRNGLAQALRLAGDNDAALVEIDRAIHDWRGVAPDGKVREVMMLVEKANIERALNREPSVRATLAAIVALQLPEAELPPRTRAAIGALTAPR